MHGDRLLAPTAQIRGAERHLIPACLLAAAQGAACSPTPQRWDKLVSACANSQQQHLYKLYVHALPNFTGETPCTALLVAGAWVIGVGDGPVLCVRVAAGAVAQVRGPPPRKRCALAPCLLGLGAILAQVVTGSCLVPC